MKTTVRHEYKYMISYVDYFRIVEQLKTLMIHDKHGDENSYPVRSVYLDDLVFSGASDKAFGNERHKKYRVRFYHDEQKKKLECKFKIGEISEKTSTLINDEMYKGIIESDFNVLSKFMEDELIRKYSLDLLKSHLKPTMFLEYQREAFRDSLDNVRITFDHSLCGERFNEDLKTVDYQLMGNDKLILEVKYEHFLPKELKAILQQIHMDHVAYSKYFMGFTTIEF